MSWTYHPDLLARPIPRYTSYPTAAEFHDRIGSDDMAEALDRVAADETVSLYVHIPYCREICWYCGCNTGAANRTRRLDSYLERLEDEIALVAARLDGRGRIGRIAFGGGSPNAIAPAQFDRLVATIRRAFQADGAILSIEIDPRGFAEDWAAALARNRVSRASLGVQTFAPAIQAAIGRVQPMEDVVHTVAQLRSAGVGSINFDLMYGLPGQSRDDLADTIERTIALDIDRIALFGYAHVPHLIPRQRRIDATVLPDAAARFAQAELGHAMLTRAGYAPVGFDHFAKPGDALVIAARTGTLRRNFQGFTEDPARTLIGLGATAISEFPDRLLQNEKNTGRYHMLIGEGRFAATRGVHRSRLDRIHGGAIEALLTRGRTTLPPEIDAAAIAERLRPFRDRGLVTWIGRTLAIAPAALPYARSIAAAFDRYRAPDDRRFSNAV
ncbi:oxygen-independent coproporphyrinogen III oxidase [Sphingomonas sp. MMS24-J13]|uniref:oxygen-independent coproporphyrinogen III oxidase n=1 Tax=Sphingomonas sp. MMS24-J13 TaxID=3238686 RepID=UPI00384EA983